MVRRGTNRGKGREADAAPFGRCRSGRHLSAWQSRPSRLATTTIPTAGTPSASRSTRRSASCPSPRAPQEHQRFWFGPYVVPAGSDANRADLDLPVANGFIISVEPNMRRVERPDEPAHQEAHIHHAHWFALDPGNEEDNYTYGNTEWIFGNGDEETKADFTERSAADPNGPDLRPVHRRGGRRSDDLHAAQQDPAADARSTSCSTSTFMHGTTAELDKACGRPDPRHHRRAVRAARSTSRASRTATASSPPPTA